jgi:hypothetical protein
MASQSKEVILMSKKDYIAIAEVFRKYKSSHPETCRICDRIAEEIAEVLKKDNPRFSFQRFWDFINETV